MNCNCPWWEKIQGDGVNSYFYSHTHWLKVINLLKAKQETTVNTILSALCTSRIFILFRTIQVKFSLKLTSPVSHPIYLRMPQAIQHLYILMCVKWERKSLFHTLTATQSLHLAPSSVSLVPTPNKSPQQSFPYCLPLLLPPGDTCGQPYTSAAKWKGLMLWRYEIRWQLIFKSKYTLKIINK